MSNISFRHATKHDCDQLLILMKKLATFENYINDFTVTVDDLIAYGYSVEKNVQPNFTALVAEQNDELIAYLVYYLIPFTYDLKPTLFIKELYVDKDARTRGVGKGLMELTIEDAKNNQCGRLKWDVLSDNINAQKFYQRFGAVHDDQWQGYVLRLT